MKLMVILSVGLMLMMAASANAELKVGDQAPDFTLKGTDGKSYQLSELGQASVVAWYPKALTGGWTKECQSLRESGDALRKFDVAYFGASCDTVELNKKFADKLDLDYPLLSDTDGSVAKAYGIHNGRFSGRVTFIVSKEQKILAIIKKVNVSSHGADIAKLLNELGVSAKSKK